MPEPVLAGHDFVGWAFDDAGENMVTEFDKVVAGLTIYAIYEEE